MLYSPCNADKCCLIGAVKACTCALNPSCAAMPAGVGVIVFLVVVGLVGAVVELGAVGVPPVALGLGAFGADTLGAVGVPNFLAFCVLLLRLI